MSKRPFLSTRWAVRLAFLALLLLTLWHYQASLHFGFWWDDPVWYSHMRGRTWWELLRPTPEFQYYRPGTMLYVSFFLRDDGTYDAFALHWLQIGWHLLQVALSFAIARLLKLRPFPAFFVALLVALFPFSYQATAWAAPQQPMAAAFQGGAWLLFLLGTRQQRRGWYGVSLLLFFVAMLLQESSVALAFVPFLLLLVVKGGWAKLGGGVAKRPFLAAASTANWVAVALTLSAGGAAVCGGLVAGPPAGRHHRADF
jgi:hypothetical protein